MKFFVDTAEVGELKAARELGMLDGVTTNPTLLLKSGRKIEDAQRKICSIAEGKPVSLECVEEKAPKMIEEGRRLARIAKNVVVKVPMTPEGMKTCQALSQEGIPINVTLCFSPAQALIAAKSGARYISPFVGRLDDVAEDGMELVTQILAIYRNYQFATEVLVASVRHPVHVVQAAMRGAHIATLPFAVMKKLFDHPLTDKGVQSFLKDYRESISHT